MPDEDLARRAVKLLNESGVDGCFYWYDNNWHYHRKWDHLKGKIALGNLSDEMKQGIDQWNSKDFRSSDQWMSRTLSCLIKLSWSQEELLKRTETMKKVLRSLL